MNETLLADPKGPVAGCNELAIIKVPTDSAFFRDLAVYLYFFKDPKTGTVSNYQFELRESGFGFPGLLSDSVTALMLPHGNHLVFDLQFTMEFRVGSMEKAGFTVPLPFPTHQCTIHGTYNSRTGSKSATFLWF